MISNYLSIESSLQLFYDLDILDEKTIIEWASKVSKKYVSKEISAEIHDKAAPFVKWLKEAEEEESSDDDDDDVEIEYDDRAKVEPLRKGVQPSAAATKKQQVQDDDEDDIDIDDI